MATASNSADDFIFEDDFDAILAVLEEEENIDKEFETAAHNTSKQEMECPHCTKKYKTICGLRNHIKCKHTFTSHKSSEPILSCEDLIKMLSSVKTFIVNNENYLQTVRKTVKSCLCIQQNNININLLLTKVQPLFENLYKSGVIEMFYTACYTGLMFQPPVDIFSWD